MSKHVLTIILLATILAGNVEAQTRKKSRPKKPAPKKTAVEEKPAPPPIIGSTVMIITKSGDQIGGTLVELTAYSARIKSDNLESVISLDTVLTITLSGAAPSKGHPQGGRPSADFSRDAETILAAF